MADEKPEVPEDGAETAPSSENAAAAAAEKADATPAGAPEESAAETPASDPASDGLEQEQKIKEELGIGAETQSPVSEQQIDQMLDDAVGEYDPSTAASLSQPGPQTITGTVPEATTSNDPAVVDQNLHLLRDVNMKVKVELGRGQMYLKDILKLGQGSVVELERLAGDPLDIYVNEKVIARGEVLVLNENFCIRITEIYDHALA